MKTFLEITKGVIQGITICTLFFAAFTVITSKSEFLFGIQSFVVLSGSMNPTLPVGSIIYSYPVSNYDYGDIIVFTSNGVNVTHRIIGELDSSGRRKNSLLSPLEKNSVNGLKNFITKGDANKKEDSHPVGLSQVKGKIFMHFPYVGKWTNLLKTPLGFILTVILPTMIYICFELWNIKTEIEKNAERKALKKMGIL